MLWFGTVLAVAVAAVCGLAWWLLRARRMPLGNFVGVIGLAVWLAGVGIALLVDRAPQGRSELVRSLDSVAWPVAIQSPLVAPAPTRPAPAAAGDGSQVASVESLIGGLEARLAAQPNDANGWALLAQSYAYTADDAALERAVKRAVELGVDEQSLRERVAGAKRTVHPGLFAAGETQQ
jgi:cytochrome c-type biogenesis protein CcmH